MVIEADSMRQHWYVIVPQRRNLGLKEDNARIMHETGTQEMIILLLILGHLQLFL